jgi:uncharacterized protein
MTFSRNNLDRSASLYLRQHASNPVWWQEWSREALDHAASTDRPLLVSVGYATCHWCHVMAADAFSNQEVADYLNEHFVAIKVDRELRPDIDTYLMQFLVATTGRGGWPLNAFLTPDGRPFYAATYVASTPRLGLPGFTELLRLVLEFYREKGDSVEPFELRRTRAERESPPQTGDAPEDHLRVMESAFDRTHAGFGTTQKFPPHSTLLYLLYRYAALEEPVAELMARATLDRMLQSGLHDHLQGGFFRYCVDREWTVPHFEKMLYDQALLLWSYAAGFKLFEDPNYEHALRGIIRCLDETFARDGLYASGHDADTNHEEGATYLWTLDEIRTLLSPDQYAAFTAAYTLTQTGEIADRGHLRRGVAPAEAPEVRDAEEILLTERRKRPQPQVDTKAMTMWNALCGCALIEAGRALGDPAVVERGTRVWERMVQLHLGADHLAHSSLPGAPPETGNAFLSDHAALLLLATYIQEETGDQTDLVADLRARVAAFRPDQTWIESTHEDFRPIPADPFDQPVPSGESLAEYALLRAALLTEDTYGEIAYAPPLELDFRNLAALACAGYMAVVGSPEPIAWDSLPLNSLQHRAPQTVTCYQGLCSPGLPDRAPKKEGGPKGEPPSE